jgi:tetratricopeptide (TPR) repeat protein
MMYYNHNIHFLASASAMNGRYADAIKAARELEANVKPLLKTMPMLEMFAPYPIVTLVRFRRWDEILKLQQPAAKLKITTAFWHFARGMAYTARNEITSAEAELKAAQAAAALVPAETSFGNSSARDVLKVAEQMLAGRIVFVRDRDAGIALLKKAVEAEDAVGYNEPPDWDLPVREILGGVLLVKGDYVEAERVFRAELSKHPRNGRALFGLQESLKRQDNASAAQMVQREFDKAWSTADTKLRVEDLAGMSVRAEAAITSKQGLP